jgi:hypothetical protein
MQSGILVLMTSLMEAIFWISLVGAVLFALALIGEIFK